MNKLMKRAAMIFRLAAYDFKGVYAGSALGSLWAIAEPLVTVAVYWFVYTVAFGGGDIGSVPYYLWLSAGIAPWFFISGGLRAAAAAYRDYSYLIKKVSIDISILPKVRVVSTLFSHLIFLGLVLALCICTGIGGNFVYVLLPMLLSAFLVFSLGRILALLCGICKDILNATGVILNIGFWITPVFWRADGTLGSLQRIIYLNPAVSIVEGYRAALLSGAPMELGAVIYIALLCLIFWIGGIILERNFLPDITDRL